MGGIYFGVKTRFNFPEREVDLIGLKIRFNFPEGVRMGSIGGRKAALIFKKGRGVESVLG